MRQHRDNCSNKAKYDQIKKMGKAFFGKEDKIDPYDDGFTLYIHNYSNLNKVYDRSNSNYYWYNIISTNWISFITSYIAPKCSHVRLKLVIPIYKLVDIQQARTSISPKKVLSLMLYYSLFLNIHNF